MGSEDVPAVGTSRLGGAVGVEGELPVPAVDADVVVELALCRAAGYAVLRLSAECHACLRLCVVVVKSA